MAHSLDIDGASLEAEIMGELSEDMFEDCENEDEVVSIISDAVDQETDDIKDGIIEHIKDLILAKFKIPGLEDSEED